MSDLGSFKYIKGSLRYKGATDDDISLPIPIENTIKELEEYSRNTNLNLALLFDTERQASTIFVPTCKFNIVFENAYVGKVGKLVNNLNYPYPPFNNNLYYSNTSEDKQNQISYNCTEPIAWEGYPQYDEFKFIRTDYGIPGWTVGPNKHLKFQASECTFYNWYFHLSYVYSSTTASTMQYQSGTTTYTWTAGDGIPFTMTKTNNGEGKPVLRFKTPCPHGLSVGEYVILNFTNNANCDNISAFEVYGLGNGFVDSELTSFDIYDVGYLCNVFTEGVQGTFKRVLDVNNIQETTSKYYVRLHKILTPFRDAIINNSGFENNALRTNKKFESKSLQPPYLGNEGRVSVKEDSLSYNVSFQDYLDIKGIIDNQRRPISEIFITVINRGFFGWFNKPGETTNVALRQGWDFNLGPQLNNWWSNFQSLTNIPTNFWNNTEQFNNYQSNATPLVSQRTFYYNRNLNTGDTIHGDYCEWNDFDQKERVISDYYHKLTFNPDNFSIGADIQNQLGYYYKPHHKMAIKEYSPYVEQSDEDNPNNYRIENFPNYAYYSPLNNDFRWRDLYPYGFIDENNIGVDYPFMNGRHYLYDNFFFKIIPEGTNVFNVSSSVDDPIIDGCE